MCLKLSARDFSAEASLKKSIDLPCQIVDIENRAFGAYAYVAANGLLYAAEAGADSAGHHVFE